MDFTQAWLTAWNSHDLDLILSHYSQDIQFTSPLAIKLLKDNPTGIVNGKDELRDYWSKGLALNPNLKFELINVCVGVPGTLSIQYKVVIEVFWFEDHQHPDIVTRSMAFYSE
ncbi:hypothetical protein BDR26DRAFT_852594 [Obelidium mucronatum]|nr:hypothetical protein BDR26DRAFT_852594 [Obelidium mucronatum]